MDDVSICICTRDRPEELEATLASIARSTVPVAQIVVADDGHDHATRAVVERAELAAQYLSGPRRGLGANRNVAARAATGRLVLFLDDDCLLDPAYLETATAAMRAAEGVYGCDRVIVTGTELNGGRVVAANEQTFLGFQSRPYRPGESMRTIVINATLFPARLFETVRFDPHLRYGYDEVDIAARAVAAGFRIVPARDARNDHRPSPRGRSSYVDYADAARLYVTVRRYLVVERRYARGIAFAAAAPTHLALARVRRDGLLRGGQSAGHVLRAAGRMLGAVGREPSTPADSDALTITLVAHHIGPVGGMELQLGTLVTALLRAGARVTVIARRCELPPHPRLTVFRVRTPRRPFPIAYPWFALAASWVLWRRRAGVVHATGALTFARADCVTVHFCHAAYQQRGLELRTGGRGGARRASAIAAQRLSLAGERWCYRPDRVRRIVAVSPGVQGEVQRHFPVLGTRTQVIPHGVDSQRFRPDPDARRRVREHHGLSDDALVAVFVGSEWRRKGLAHAIEAIAIAGDWTLLVVGEGRQPEYASLASRLGVPNRLRFAGVSRDVAAHMAAGDVFVLPTLYETFCLVGFEAAAVGLPLLVSRVSGPDLLIEPGVCGEFLDRDQARTARLLTRYGDPDLRHAHGAAARQRAATFTWDAASSAYIELYRHLAESP